MTATTLPHRRGRVSRPRLAAESVLLAAAGLIAALALAPIAALAVIAAHGTGNLWGHLAQYVLPDALVTTALLLAGVGTLVTVVGVGTAWLVATCRFPGRATFEWALLLPLAVPTYIVAYAYVDVVHPLGPTPTAIRALLGLTNPRDLPLPNVRSLAGCIILLGAVLYPYVYLTARATFLVQTANAVEVARTLGTGPAAAFFRIALPLARPAIVVGVSLALMETLNDIGASEFLGVGTLTVAIYSTWVNQSSLAGAAQIACIMLAVVILLIAVERHGRRDRRYALSTRRPRTAQAVRLSRGAGLCAAVFCAVPVLMGFVLPIGFLIREVARRGLLEQIDETFLAHLFSTLELSVLATLATLVLGIVIVTASRLARMRLTKAALVITGIGYAVPGTVLALGLLTPLVSMDSVLSTIWRELTGQRVGLIIMGSMGGIMIAYVIRFMPIAVGSLSAGLDRVSPGLEDAGRILGARPRELVLKIQIPLLRPALASAALLVFVDCIKELSATLLLRPLNTETLATLVYGHASRGAFEDGSLAALVIVLIGLLPVIQLVRSAEARPRAPETSGS